MNSRTCIICKKPIHECMGFVSASDFMKGANTLQTPEKYPREICAVCGLIALENKPSILKVFET